jgi:hypothetical protein
MKTFVAAGRVALAATRYVAAAVGHDRFTAATRVLNSASERLMPVWTVHTPPPADKLALLPVWTPAPPPSPPTQSSSDSPIHIAVFDSCVVNMMGPPAFPLEGSGSDVRVATRRCASACGWRDVHTLCSAVVVGR